MGGYAVLMDVDLVDLELLAALQEDARLSNKELAARVGLAPSSTHTRLKRLRERGVLRGTSVEVADEALGIGLRALVFLRLERHGEGEVAAVWAAVAALEEVVHAWSVGGVDDLVLHVAVADAHHLRDLVHGRLPALGHVGRVRTEIVFDHLRRPDPIYSR